MSDQGGTTEAGWYPDPYGRHEHRYWDGATWSDNVSDAGTVSTDPAAGAPAADAATEVTQGFPPIETPTQAGAGLTGPPVAGVATGPPGAGAPPYVAPTSSGGGGKVPVGVLALVGLVVVAVVVALVVFVFGGDDDDGGGDGDLASTEEALSDLSDLSDFSGDFSDFSDLSDFSDFGDFSDFSDPFSDFSDLEDFSDIFSDFSDLTDLGGGGFPDDLELGDPEDPSSFIDEFGTDDGFDDLAESCFEGDLADCDELYRTTPISESTNSYEGYGATCGGRLDQEAPGTCVSRG